MAKPVQTGTKKPYSSPKLIVHGTVHELTRASSLKAKRDNSRGSRPTYTTIG